MVSRSRAPGLGRLLEAVGEVSLRLVAGLFPAAAASWATRLRAALPGRRVPRRVVAETAGGQIVLAVAGAGAGHAILGVSGALAGTVLAVWWSLSSLKRRHEQRRAALRASLPEAAELLAVAAGAGLNPYRALESVSAVATGPLGPVLAAAMLDVRAGRPIGDALRGAAATHDFDELRAVARAISAAERQGMPLAPALRRLAADQRERLRRNAEAEARKAPVRVLFPLIFCVLPAFILLTVVPALVHIFELVRS